MKPKILISMVLIFALSGFGTALAMQSANFRLTPSVMSGGGGMMSSASFRAHTVLGQPTPIMDQDMAPGSSNFTLYPGFLYALSSPSFCLWDNEPDGDVDGLDLYNFIPGYNDGSFGPAELLDFSGQFGKDDCF